ncbi:hypothetical protein C8R46DRAFT_385351 [Mycena filopes]|nr:hypothetical protein C8R46DRAFT_385351 [Mycena filopes]
MIFSGPWTRPWAATLLCFHLLPFSLSASIHPTIEKRDALSDSGLASASWIWAAEGTTGNVAFARTFPSAVGKVATSATIWMTAVNQFTLWVNQQPIGASAGDGVNDWMTVQLLSAALNSSLNTFSVLAVHNATSGGPSPGLLASISVSYDDGTDDIVVSDASWVVSALIPPRFPAVTDSSEFTPATIAGIFGSGSWGSSTSLTIPSIIPNSAVLVGRTQIWSTSTALSGAPAGTVGFRKTLTTASGKTAVSAQILIAVDNGFLLYLNGVYIGAPPPAPTIPDYRRAQRLAGIALDAASNRNVFTVFAANLPAPPSTDPGPASLVAELTIQYADGSSDLATTDTTWLCSNFTDVPRFLAQADADLAPSFALETVVAGQVIGPSDVLAAPKVPVGPFVNETVLPAPSSTGGGSGSSNTPSPTPAAGHHTPVGAIVGPIVAVLVLLGAGLALFCWRRRRRARPSEPSNDGSNVSPWQQQLPPGSNATWTSASLPQEMSSVVPQSQYVPISAATTTSPTTSPYVQPPPLDAHGYPQPQAPPSKLARERMYGAFPAGSQVSSSLSRQVAAENENENEAPTLAPPSYYTL